MKKKISFKRLAAYYCGLLFLLIIFTSLPYGDMHFGNETVPVSFSDGWSVSADGGQLDANAKLPYELAGRGYIDIELRNTIPDYPFKTAVMETVVFQKDVRVYVDGELVLERVFEKKSFNQNTPGSGRIFVPLPADSQGKEVVIKLHKVVLEDDGPVANISIMDGLMSDRSITSLSSSAFLATVLMFFVGVCLLVTCLAYLPAGVKVHSLSTMAMFVITASLWVMCNSKSMQFFTDNWVLIHNLEYMAFFSTPLWLWLFLSYNWNSHKKICNIAINVMLIFITITFTAKALGLLDFYFFLELFHILAILNIIVILVLGLRDIRRQPPALKAFFLGIGGLCFTSVIDLVRYYTVFSPDAMAFFFIFGIIFMGICLFLTFIIVTKEKFMVAIEDNVYKELAFNDILTSLNSRAKWDADISEIESKIGAYDSIVTAMIDVNDLKKVNDRFGHHEGDRMLTTVSDALKSSFNGTGSCYRLGGDEFCIIALNRSLDEVVCTISQVAEALEKVALPYSLSFAWGCAKYNSATHQNLSDTLREADNLMYEFKRKQKSASAKL